jgi:hypothetical protein
LHFLKFVVIYCPPAAIVLVMHRKVSFYCYLFAKPVDTIIRYEILWKDDKKYLLKSTMLYPNFKSATEDIVVMVFESLSATVSGIIGRLRNSEIGYRVYKDLLPEDQLDLVYRPWVQELLEAIIEKNIMSFSLFGNIAKYKPQTAAKEFLKSMGYFVLTTQRPHVYVLDDFIQKEKAQLHQ